MVSFIPMAVVAVAAVALASAACTSTTRLIVDTDHFSDVDDAASLLLASTLPCVDLLAVQVNYGSAYSVLAVSSILTHYGLGDVPLGLLRPFKNETFADEFYFSFSDYVGKVQHHFNRTLQRAEDAWNPTKLYRKTLAAEKDASVIIASIGFFDNLFGLLHSEADEYSPLTGAELIKVKVKKLVIMGGAYPSGWEYNFGGATPLVTADVINNWPGAMTFSGASPGQDVVSGACLSVEGPEGDPVKAAYTWYNGYNVSRFSWDPLTVLYAVEGEIYGIFLCLGTMFKYGNTIGRNHILYNGSNVWLNDTTVTNQHWLELLDDVTPQKAGDILDELYLKGARSV